MFIVRDDQPLMENRFQIYLNGHFAITAPDGRDCTPVGQKAQALLALLATSETLRRSRNWLQDKLWSLSPAEQGSASLRQTLRSIRKCFGDAESVFSSNRLSVWLVKECVDIHWNKTTNGVNTTFLEGIDVRDPEFEDWLILMRSQDNHRAVHIDPAASSTQRTAARWKVIFRASAPSPEALTFIDIASRNVIEYGEIETVFDEPQELSDTTIVVDVRPLRSTERNVQLRVKAARPSDNHVFWSGNANYASTQLQADQNLEVLSLAFRLQSALLKEIAVYQPDKASPLVLAAAIPRIFSFQSNQLNAATRTLTEAMDTRRAAQMLGWQAQIAVINLIERFTDAPEECIAQGKLLAAKAVEADPMNSIVLSTAANAQVLLDWDVGAGAELAELAVRVNRSNPLAWWAKANAALYASDPQKALEAARLGAHLAARTPLQFWCDFQVGLAALEVGDLEMATRALETSAALSPQFRPPRRYLLALHAQNGDRAKADRMRQQLIAIEPGFSMDSYIHDPDYPISLLRRRNLIDRARLLDL